MKNWYFPLSALAFFLLEAKADWSYYAGIGFAVAIALWMALRSPNLWRAFRTDRPGLRILCAFTAGGICWREGAPIALCIAALPFVYLWVSRFWKWLLSLPWPSVDRRELAFYAAVLLLSLGAAAYAFSRTEAFYGGTYYYDLIYCSDSCSIVGENAYLCLTHQQNDIRQPLFAVFAAPFIAGPYFVGKLLSLSGGAMALLMNAPQIALLLLGQILLAQLLELSPGKRVCFVAGGCCMYSYLLFSLMMEQYILAFFYLALFLYLLCRNRPEHLALWGAGGTLLTSLIWTPALARTGFWKKMLRLGGEFLCLMLAFCRFDVLWGLVPRALFLSRFAGKSVPFGQRLLQYAAFLRNCFLAPAAVTDPAGGDYLRWQLAPVSAVSMTGILILLLALAGLWVSREKAVSRAAGLWAAFSFVMLCVLGWGTAENNLILYALYFGWALWVLVYQLLEKLDGRLAWCVPPLLLAVNLPAMGELFQFAVDCYPGGLF